MSLTDSRIWKAMEKNTREHGMVYYSPLDYFHHRLVSDPAAREWCQFEGVAGEGRHNIYSEPVLSPSGFNAVVPGEITQDLLYGYAPEIGEATDEEREGPLHVKLTLRGGLSDKMSVVRNGCGLTLLPKNADAYEIAIVTMLAKHVLLHPESLLHFGDEVTVAGQQEIARKALKVCFDQVRERGMEREFQAACGELSAHMPELLNPTEARKQYEATRGRH